MIEVYDHMGTLKDAASVIKQEKPKLSLSLGVYKMRPGAGGNNVTGLGL